MVRRSFISLACAAGVIVSSQSLGAHETSEVERLFALPLEELINIYVTSPSQTSHPIQNAANSVTLVTAAQMNAMGARTLSDVLKMLPATQILNRRNGLDSVMIRGIPSGRNTKILLMIDGVPHEEVIFGEWSPDEQIQLADIDHVEIIRGPGSALYGSNAYAGIISIYTKNANATNSQVSVTMGDYGEKRLGFSYGLVTNRTNYMGNGSFFRTDGYPMQADRYGNPTDHNNAVHAYDVHFKMKNEHWQASLSVNDYGTEYPLYPDNENKTQDYTFIESNVKHVNNWQYVGLESQLYMYNVQRFFDHKVVDKNGGLDFYATSKLNTTLFGFRNQVNYKFSRQENFIAGLLLERQCVSHYDETAIIDSGVPNRYSVSQLDKNGDATPDVNNYAVYAQQESSLLDDALTITGGLRLDQFDQLDSRVSPRLGLTYNSSQNWSTKLLWGRAFRKPTLLEQYEVRSDNNSPGNPGLTPEDIETTEAEYTYSFSQKTYASIAVFRSKMLHFIQTVDLQPYQNNENTLVIPGATLEWNSHFDLDGWRLGVAANYTRLRTDIAGAAPASANVMLFSDNDKMGFYVGANSLGRRNAAAGYHALVTNSQLKGRENNKAYAVFDAAVRWKQLPYKNWQLGLTLHNIFDKTYYNPDVEPEDYYDMTKEPRELALTAVYSY